MVFVTMLCWVNWGDKTQTIALKKELITRVIIMY